MKLKLKRNLIERAVGKIAGADARLGAARGRLQDEYFLLQGLLESRNTRLTNQALIDRMRERYDGGKRSFWYRLAGERAQRDYDSVWQIFGDLIKTYQARGLIGRENISLAALEGKIK